MRPLAVLATALGFLSQSVQPPATFGPKKEDRWQPSAPFFEKVVSLDRISEDRYEHLKSGLDEIKRAEGAESEKAMSTGNVEATPLGGILPMLMNQGGSTAGAAAAAGFIACSA